MAAVSRMSNPKRVVITAVLAGVLRIDDQGRVWRNTKRGAGGVVVLSAAPNYCKAATRSSKLQRNLGIHAGEVEGGTEGVACVLCV